MEPGTAPCQGVNRETEPLIVEPAGQPCRAEDPGFCGAVGKRRHHDALDRPLDERTSEKDD